MKGVRKDKQKQIKLATITIALSLLFSLSLAEVVIRIVFPYNTPDSFREHSIQYLPAVYAKHLLKPVDQLIDLDSAKAWGDKPDEEDSDRMIYVNANGYRGPSFAVRKPANTTRIIVLGGSAVFDQNVSDSRAGEVNTWPHLIQERLRMKGYKNIEVINAGIPGHSSADSLGRLYSQLWLYKPDIVLIYHAWNDIKFWRKWEITPERPLITHITPYNPVKNPFTSYQGVWDKILCRSQLYVKARNKYYYWIKGVGSEGVISKDEVKAPDYGELGPQQFQLNMELIVAASKAIGAIPVFITQATLVVPESPPEDRARIRYNFQDLNHEAIVRAFEHTYRIIRDIGNKTGTEVIDAAKQLNGRSDLFGDHVHTTPKGSKELAQIVASQLEKILVSAKKPISQIHAEH